MIKILLQFAFLICSLLYLTSSIATFKNKDFFKLLKIFAITNLYFLNFVIFLKIISNLDLKNLALSLALMILNILLTFLLYQQLIDKFTKLKITSKADKS
jgi:hypothetical protein